ncbi:MULTISPECIES: helix-turn-helix domain-containing protein [Dyadobacter]|jgi:transcriptional regulator with XRE-family HTH domain|uniref:XRE family transcriptional regulator n=1 Tax=Dyadobacter psychrotolerans TaxID=2541721 RepID=A0A4R5DQD4_9BACT|nr:helix-turn-helix transcriptional regulator [Dyadobacter psychrotolerans]TDE13215.1 XRE family transcriptional regulator [Dyadobacter psychrotolerans]
METSVRKIIGRNVKALREALGLSQMKFAILIGMSRASVINIESGKNGYNLNLLDNILTFSNYRLEDITKQSFEMPENIREILAEHYKESLDLYATLTEKPTIVYAINYRLMKSHFLDHPKEINEIKVFFENIGWSFKGTSIQNALKRMPQLILIEKHKLKENTFVYSKRCLNG